LQQLYIFTAGNFPRYPSITPLKGVTKCITGASNTPCITITYAPSGYPEIDAVMAIVARRQGLTIANSVIMAPDANGKYSSGQVYPSQGLADIIPFYNSSVLTNFVLNYQNVSQVGKFF
jgi:hypothetical protein